MNVHVFDMPIDFGASRHGSDMGPSAIHLAGLDNRLTNLGYTNTQYLSPVQLDHNDFESLGSDTLRYLQPIVKACSQLASAVENSIEGDNFPVILGGDHSVVLGSVAGLSAALPDKKIGVLYVDAHGDFNTEETSPTGNIHGMCMSASCGYGVPELTNLHQDGQKIDPKNVCFVGCRDLDRHERVLMKEAGVNVFTMSDITRDGISAVMQKVIAFFKQNVDVVHISFDMDVLDPQFAPGVGIQVPYGLNPREAFLIMEEMSNTNMVCSCDVVEVNPVLDIQSLTAKTAVDLIARLLGERLY